MWRGGGRTKIVSLHTPQGPQPGSLLHMLRRVSSTTQLLSQPTGKEAFYTKPASQQATEPRSHDSFLSSRPHSSHTKEPGSLHSPLSGWDLGHKRRLSTNTPHNPHNPLVRGRRGEGEERGYLHIRPRWFQRSRGLARGSGERSCHRGVFAPNCGPAKARQAKHWAKERAARPTHILRLPVTLLGCSVGSVGSVLWYIDIDT